MDQDVTWLEIGRGPGDIVLDGDPAPPTERGTAPPLFGLYLLWPNGWMNQDTIWNGGRSRPVELAALLAATKTTINSNAPHW